MILRQHEVEERGGTNFGELNGTTLVEIVPAPSAGFTRVVEDIFFVQLDTVAQQIRVRLTTTDPLHYQFHNSGPLDPGAIFHPIQKGINEFRLSEADLSITALMDAVADTNEPSWVACWRDVPIPVD